MQLKNFLIISSLALLTISCGRPDPETIVETRYVEQQIDIQQHPKEVILSDVHFDVVTSKNLDEYIIEFEKENGELAFVAISVRDYENLATNTAELYRYILQLLELVDYYENSINGEI